jgi:cobalt-zinc-cadmium resistance protein CzcA
VNERLREAAPRLPAGLEPSLGPIATGLGEIFMFAVHADPGAISEDGEPWTPMALRTLQDWVIKPQLRNVRGVTEVNTVGGYVKEIHVTPRPERLVAHRLTFEDLRIAIARNSTSTGAGYIERSGEQYLVRAPGQLATPRTTYAGSSSATLPASRSGSTTSPTSRSAASCEPAPRRRTARRSSSAPSSC